MKKRAKIRDYSKCGCGHSAVRHVGFGGVACGVRGCTCAAFHERIKLTPRPKTEAVHPFFARKLEVIDPPGGYSFVGLNEQCSMIPHGESYALPVGDQERKGLPIARGCLDYFPAALAEVAHLSKVGNDKHNPGEPLHHARGKSMDHADCIVRHLMDRGTVDTDGVRHSAKVAWRALALLQEELEAAGARLARGARLPET